MSDIDKQFAAALRLIQGGSSVRAAAREIGIARGTLRARLEKSPPYYPAPADTSGPDLPGISGDHMAPVIASTPMPDSSWTPEALLAAHDLDPDKYEVVSARASRWGNPEEPMEQLRINAIRKDSLLQVPDLSKFEAPDLSGIEEFSTGCTVFLADAHAPYHDVALQEALLEFLAAEQPGRIVFLGDEADYSVISKHRTHPRFAALVNETNDAVVKNLYEVRCAAPDAEIILLPGNHDQRLLYAMQDHEPNLYNVRPGAIPGEDEPIDSLNFRNLWQLDKLGIEFVDEEWKLAKYQLTPELTARHGHLTGANSERQLLQKYGRSQVHGHLHRGSVIYRTKHDPLDIRVVLDCGTRAAVKPDGLGYEPEPDWTPGIGIGHFWEDQKFVLSFAPFIDNELLIPDGRKFAA